MTEWKPPMNADKRRYAKLFSSMRLFFAANEVEHEQN